MRIGRRVLWGWVMVAVMVLQTGAAMGGVSLIYWPASWDQTDKEISFEKDTGMWGVRVDGSGRDMFAGVQALAGNFAGPADENFLHAEARAHFGFWIRLPNCSSPELLGLGLGYRSSVASWDESIEQRWGRSVWHEDKTVSVVSHGPIFGVQGNTWLAEWATEQIKDSAFEDFDIGLSYGLWYSPVIMGTTSDDVLPESDGNGKAQELEVAGCLRYADSIRLKVGYRATKVTGLTPYSEETKGAFIELGFWY